MKKSTITLSRFQRGMLTLIALFAIACVQAQTRAEKIDQLLSTYAEYGQFNGTVLVSQGGEVIYKKGFGMANMEWQIPNQPDTKLRLGSITKQFTAMLIVQLAAENKLDLQAPIATYLPDYPGSGADVITIHHLLTHTSGIPNYTSFRAFWEVQRDHYRPADFISFFADSALSFPPGERFEYSNSGYFLLGYIIEKVSGKSYEQMLQEKIFDPLHMQNTGYDHSEAIIPNRASGYDRSLFGDTYRNANYISMSLPYAAGSMYSTVEDLYLWDQALYTEKLLPQAYLDLMLQKHISAGNEHYGYGLDLGEMTVGNTEARVPTIGHGGGIDGFSTLVTRFPEDKSMIVILNNTGRAPLYAMTIAINGILHDKPYDAAKQSVAQALGQTIQQKGIERAEPFFKSIKDAKTYYLHEGEMNMLGYYFLEAGKAAEAAVVFKLNVDAFPQSANAYDSYGEALMALGKNKEAIKNYQKSLELDPDNENGKQMLRRLGVNP